MTDAPPDGSDSDSGVDLAEYEHVIRELWEAELTYRDMRYVLQGRYGLDITLPHLKRFISDQDWYEPRGTGRGPADVLREAGFDPDAEYAPETQAAADAGDDTWRRYYDTDEEGDAS